MDSRIIFEHSIFTNSLPIITLGTQENYAQIYLPINQKKKIPNQSQITLELVHILDIVTVLEVGNIVCQH